MSHVGVVREMYEAFGRGDVPAILERLSASVEWEHDSADHGVPWLVPRRGRAEVARFFEALGAVQITRFEPRALLEGPGQVAAVIAVELTVKATGKTVRDLEVHLWTFDDAGRVARFRHVVDTHQHLLATQG